MFLLIIKSKECNILAILWGNRALADTYVVGRDYNLNISYSVQNPELLAFKIGTYFEENTRDVYFQKTYTVRKDTYPAYTAGQFGFGIEADADAIGSYLVNHVSTPLTQQPYATFTAATANSFAVGANGALKFSTNLVTANQTVSIRIPYTLTGLSIGETIVGEHSISAILITKENEVVLFTAFSAKPDLSNGTIDPSAEGLEIPMFVKTPPGECLAYDLLYTGLKVQCN